MNVKDLRALFRSEADDVKTPPLWSDTEVLEYANDAQNEACRRGRLLVDSTTAGICTLTIAAGDEILPLDPRVIFVRRGRLVSDNRKLIIASYRDLDAEGTTSQWEVDTGTPTHLITDLHTGALRPYPIPEAAVEVRLTVVRLPFQDLAEDTDEPEINPRYQRNLRHWMLYRAYSKQDADTFDNAKAAKALAVFEMEFGKPSRAFDEEWIMRQQQTNPYDGVY